MRGSPAPAPSTAATSSRRRHVLQQIAGRADAQRGEQVGLLLGHGEDQDLDAVGASAQLGADLDAAQLGHPQVGQEHVGLDLLGEGERLATVGGEADDLDARVAVEQRRRALAHQAVIVGDEDAHHDARSMVGRARWMTSRRIPAAGTERPAPEVLAGLGALARVSRALVGTGSLAELGKRALAEMRAALGLDLAVLYLPVPGEPGLTRFVSSAAAGARLAAREEVRYEPEAWRLAVTSGMPIVLREPASWLGPNPFVPPAHDWLVLPLVAGRNDMVGVVVAAAAGPIALDPREHDACSPCSGSSSAPASPPRGCASGCRRRRSRASAGAWPPTCTTAWRRTSPWRCASWPCSTSRTSSEAGRARAGSGCARRSGRRTGSSARAWRTCASRSRSAACAARSRRRSSASAVTA